MSIITRRSLLTGAAALAASRADAQLFVTLSYLGLVATRCYLNTNFANGLSPGWNSRTAHYARANITSLKVVFSNWYVHADQSTDQPETVATGTLVTTASIEYPVGTFTQVKWSGASSVTLPGTLANTISDAVSVNIPAGALFWIRRYQNNSTALAFALATHPVMNLALGDAVNNSGSDETLSGTVVDNGNGALIPVQGIVATISQPSICALGSSRMLGWEDTTIDSTGDSGYARMFGGQFGYINGGVGGDTVTALTASHAGRMGLAQFCSHLWLDPGLNDFNLHNTPESTVLSDLVTLAGLWPNPKKVIFNNEGPWTTSTDSWATTANQTVTSFEASRLSLNSSLAALTGYNQLVDANSFDSTAPTSGFWNNPVSDGFTFTPDGIHENSATLIRLLAAGKFNPVLVRVP